MLVAPEATRRIAPIWARSPAPRRSDKHREAAPDSPSHSDDAWVPLPIAARRLRRLQRAVLVLIRQGCLIARLVGRRWFVQADSVERFGHRRRAA